MKRLALPKTLFCTLAFVCIGAWSASANLVVNPGFETGDFTGWTLTDPSGNSNVGNDPLFAHSGTYHANLGTMLVPPGPPTTGSLSQMLVTTPGTLYTLSFWLANDTTPGTNQTNSFEVFWNGMLISTQANSPVFDYTQFTFANLAATGPSTTLNFVFENDPDFWRLDDVSVSGVPDESQTIWLALPTFAALGLLHFRRKAAKARA